MFIQTKKHQRGVLVTFFQRKNYTENQFWTQISSQVSDMLRRNAAIILMVLEMFHTFLICGPLGTISLKKKHD